MNKAAAAEALSLYDKIDLIRAWVTSIQRPRKDRRWDVHLMGRNGFGEFEEAVGEDVIRAITSDEILDVALTPLMLHHARLLMAQHGERLFALGFIKPDGCP